MKDARRLQFRLFRLLSLRLALTLSAGTLFAAGLLALLLRILASPSPLVLTLLVLAAALFPVVPAAVAAWRRTPLASQCLAWLDAASQSGGLLLMGSQPGAEAWRSSIPPALPEPRLNWRDTRRPALWLAAAAFAAAVLLVPDPLIRAVLAAPLDLSPLLAPLEKKAAALLDPDIPPPTAPENWRQELDATAALQDGTDPARALEALDHLRDQMDQAGAQAANTLVREQELLRASEAAAESIRAQFADGGGESQAAQDSLGAFNDFLAAQEWPASLTNALPSELLEALSAGALTPDQLAALSDLLRQEGNRLAGQLNKLCDARLVEASRCPPGSLCTNGAACEAALARFLDQDGGDSLAACLSGSRPGRGGVSRGRGDAPLTWTDLSSPEGAGFKDIRLAAASMPSPDAAKPIGLSAAAPDAKPSAAPLQPGALTSAQAAPQAGRSAVILPRHRAAVERYFQSPPAPERTP